MSRIRTAYESKLRDLLASVGARRLDLAVHRLVQKGEQLANKQGVAISTALRTVYEQTRDRIRRARRAPYVGESPRFLCDAGLGGLARWLRAAGYEAEWRGDIRDAELVHEAQRDDLVIVTTDSLFMDRRAIRRGEVKAVWIPPALRASEQLALVLKELQLPVLQSRCMDCGGELQRVNKEAVCDRIPPRTYKWLDEYYECKRCGKLFWHGTHYQRIRERLQNLAV